MRPPLILAVLTFGAALATGAHASAVFSQDFSGDLSANEQMGGRFQVSGGRAGHIDYGYENYEYSYYQLALDLTHVTDAQLQLDYFLFAEVRWDGANMLASTDGPFDPATDLLAPVGGGGYAPLNGILPHLGRYALTGQDSGTLVFDLAQFAGQVVNLRFQFEADLSNTWLGLSFDDVQVTGTFEPGYEPSPGGVPEPAAWALMILGFFGAGSAVRRRAALAV